MKYNEKALNPVLTWLSGFSAMCRSTTFVMASSYLSKAENIILIGNPGLGKSHIATGLALAACRQGKRVRFFGVAGLVNDLLAAKDGLRLSKFIKPITKLDLVVLDELGFIPFSKDGGQVLFQLCSDLNERVSIIIVV